jgi:small subunit ribosomal protein S4
MGDPSKARKLFKRPRRIWTTEQISSELYVLGSYGLRNKRELWRAQTEIARIRNQARQLLALSAEARHEKETQLLSFLNRLGLVEDTSTLDDILSLKVEDLLDRRLQTVIMKKSGVKSPYLARQMVVHKHITIGDRKVNIPSYLVRRDEENKILIHVEPNAQSNAQSNEANINTR